MLYGTYARRTRAEGYPWAQTLEERIEYAASIESEWGLASDMQRMCPTADEAMARWWQRRARASASPGAARALIEMNSRIDVRDVLPAVHVPTLVLHRRDDPDARVEEGRFIAEHIPDARFTMLSGADHVPWIDAAEILASIEAFLDEVVTAPEPERATESRALATTLFTDIVGSAAMNASMGDARWSVLLDRHDEIVREAVAAWRGRWIKSTGDGVLAVFETAARGLRAALAARTHLAALGMQIRVALHASEIELRGDDITGLGVAVAARLLALAEPNEILVTAIVRELVSGSGIELVERGTQVLRNIPGTWTAYAVAQAGPTVESRLSPHPRAEPSQFTTNMPQPADAFFGRDDDLQRLADAVARSRLVALAGPGGVGKTRLAIEFARRSGRECWFVDLSRVVEPAAVAGAFLDTFGVSPRNGVSDCDRLVEALEPRSLLLVVDNCEQVLDATAEVVRRVVAEAPDVRVLATSREALGVTGELVLVVAPLRLPVPSDPMEAQRDADAVRLFLERAERAGAVIDDIESVAALCRRLDGIPLALELAAARLRRVLGRADARPARRGLVGIRPEPRRPAHAPHFARRRDRLVVSIARRRRT